MISGNTQNSARRISETNRDHTPVAKNAEEHLSREQYERLAALIYQKTGIQLGQDRQTMLSARIQRRLKALKMTSYADYCTYLFGIHGQREELVHMIDVVTTNKTDFFRESAHFDYLISTAIPSLVAACDRPRPLLIWSAGCSSGEEPYTLAILLSEYAEANPGFQFQILATDISNTILEKAKKAVYTEQIVAPIAADLRRKYLMRSKHRDSDQVRIVPELRALIEFRRLNFMDNDYGLTEKADVIFCRNVIIYFDRETQENILLKLSRNLARQGYMFVGHAESLHDMNLPLTPVAPTLYRKAGSHG
jgi:chemotaxis protein methyltransferase CheR